MNKPKIVVISGPTGIGKTAVAMEVAGRFGGEIVGADSMQIYRYMDIGTAKPTSEERSRIPHHMMDIIDPDEPFDAAVYAEMATDAIEQRNAQGILAFVVGGTGLYIKALVHGLFHEKSSDPAVRKDLKETAACYGTQSLYDELRRTDPAAAQRIHSNDTFRIIRALEVFRLTGKPISEYHLRHGFSDKRFDVLKIGLDMNRAALYDRINLRVDGMIAAGLVEEVQTLLQMGYPETLKAMQAIGYRHMADYINGRLSWQEAVRTLKRDTRRYAKRQITWFKADPDIRWLETEQLNDIIRIIDNFLKNS